ncbi:hypothetical protein CapIbe_001081 [Capra ibex]
MDWALPSHGWDEGGWGSTANGNLQTDCQAERSRSSLSSSSSLPTSFIRGPIAVLFLKPRLTCSSRA